MGLLLSLIAGCNGTHEPIELEGRWEIEELYSSGLKSESQGWILFKSDGSYAAKMSTSASALEGKWNVKNSVIHLWQEEVTDLHGNRFLEPYESTWRYNLVGEYLVLEGLPAYDVQHIKLILKKPDV